MDDQERKLIPLKDAMTLTKRTEKALKKWIYLKKMPAYKTPTGWMVPLKELLAVDATTRRRIVKPVLQTSEDLQAAQNSDHISQLELRLNQMAQAAPPAESDALLPHVEAIATALTLLRRVHCSRPTLSDALRQDLVWLLTRETE